MATKLRAIVDDLNAVAEQHRDLYEPTEDGKFKLAAEGVEDVSGLKSALTREKEARRKARERLEKLGLTDEDDPDEIKALVEEGRAAREGKGKTEETVEAAKKALTKAPKTELEKRDNTIRELTESVERLEIENKATEALAEFKGSVKLMMPHIKEQTQIVRSKDGKYVARVIDAEGEERTGKGGDPMTIKELVAEMSESDDYSGAFEGSGASGSGAPPESGAGGPPNRKAPAGGTRKKEVTDAKKRSRDYAL